MDKPKKLTKEEIEKIRKVKTKAIESKKIITKSDDKR